MVIVSTFAHIFIVDTHIFGESASTAAFGSHSGFFVGMHNAETAKKLRSRFEGAHHVAGIGYCENYVVLDVVSARNNLVDCMLDTGSETC